MLFVVFICVTTLVYLHVANVETTTIEAPAPTLNDPEHAESVPLLLILSFDGLRYDFLNKYLTPNLYKLAKQGAWAKDGIKAQVMTITAPNYFTIVTGLYQEKHGIINNVFHDPDFNEWYSYDGKTSAKSKWYTGEPIWQTNEKAARYSGAMRWPMCNAAVNNLTMSRFAIWSELGDVAIWTADLERLLSWYTNKNKPINLGFFYVANPDLAKHENDIYSAAVKRKIAELDEFVAVLIHKLNECKLYHRMNIIFVADHGHVNTYYPYQTINMDEILKPHEFWWNGKSIVPNSGFKVEDLYQKLNAASKRDPKFDVWLKNDIPEKYHYKNNQRVGPIFVLEHLGYRFYSGSRPGNGINGEHGYSNDYPEMRPAFFAVGPAFKENFTIDWEIENVDLYNLMASVLKLKPAANDGNFSRVSCLMKSFCMENVHSQLVMHANNDLKTNISHICSHAEGVAFLKGYYSIYFICFSCIILLALRC